MLLRLLILLVWPILCLGKDLAEVDYVLEPFESIDHVRVWDNPSKASLFLSNESYIGSGALAVTTNASASFGFISPTPYNCHGASSISAWFKLINTPGNETVTSSANISLVLLDSSSCSDNCTSNTSHYERHVSARSYALESLGDDWVELSWDLARNGWVQESDDSTTTIPSNKTLNIAYLKGWEFLVDKPVEMLFDHLVCRGSGDLIGAALWPESNIAKAIESGFWSALYFDSPIAANQTTVDFHDGFMAFNYTIQQSAAWGGFNAFKHYAPSFAYYNLSRATALRFSYTNWIPPQPTGRSHFRLILREAAEDCLVSPHMCIDQDLAEYYYSFHYILDQDPFPGDVIMQLPPHEQSPFTFTGWSGVARDKQLNLSYIKGYNLELSIDSTLGEGTLVSGGSFEFGQFQAYSSTEDAFFETCPADEWLGTRSVAGLADIFSTHCCEHCNLNEECSYVKESIADSLRICHLLPQNIDKDDLFLSNKKSSRFSWKPNNEDICVVCDCSAVNESIDCTGKNLTAVPRTFSADWKARSLDLSGNEFLLVIGAGALDSFSSDLQTLTLPPNLRYLSYDAISGLQGLSVVSFEKSDGEHGILNVISEGKDAFDSPCCARGRTVTLVSPSSGLTFCEMKKYQLGSDADLWPFQILKEGATSIEWLTPSSEIMSEASESPAKCAAYCNFVPGCKYFTHDNRVGQAEPTCQLFDAEATKTLVLEEICCSPRHFADKSMTVPGYVSGSPPRTRSQTSKVATSVRQIELSERNNYEASFDLFLTENPRLGAVWVEPTVVGDQDLYVEFTPQRVALYDNETRVPVKVQVTVDQANTPRTHTTISIWNKVTSCDSAFSVRTSEGGDIHAKIAQVGTIDRVAVTAVALSTSFAALSFLCLAIFMTKRKKHSAWIIRLDQLTFDDEPVVLGQGTFGMVLLAELRGTEVAVKRVLPEKGMESNKARAQSSEVLTVGTSHYIDSSGGGAQSSEVFVVGRSSGCSTQRSKTRTSLVKDFQQEVEALSKLRHPCITTIIGAVPSIESPMLVMELMEHGSLYDVIHNDTFELDGDILVPILRDISRGMRFIHAAEPQILHGDLKSQNVLVDERFRAKITDFGLSAKSAFGATGTALWMAPELLSGESSTDASDVYSFGIVLYEVMSRKEPYYDWNGNGNGALVEQIIDPDVKLRPTMPTSCPQMIALLTAECLEHEAEIRPTFTEIDSRLRRVSVESIPKSQRASRNQSLLNNIFPAHVAEALRDGKTVEPDRRDSVAIFFSDIVGFTTLSAQMSASEVTDMLDNMYRTFDKLAAENGVYKIDTIGDAYMCSTNLVEDQPGDYVKRIANFAIGAVQACSQICVPFDGKTIPIEIRCGIHIGPVVARVVGTTNPKYTTFGDAVNTASRMESNSVPGHIQCSEKTALILSEQAPEIPLCRRGDIPIKGKGVMTTYFINKQGERPVHATADPEGPKPEGPKSAGRFQPVKMISFRLRGENATSSKSIGDRGNPHSDTLV